MNPAFPTPSIGKRIHFENTDADSMSRHVGLWRLSPQSRLWLVGGLVSGTLLYAIFLFIGSDVPITTVLCAAWVVAWTAVAVAGGFQTVTGWFAFFPLFHFMLFALPLKVLVWEPAQSRLLAPVSTPLSMLLFYSGLLAAVFLVRLLKIGGRPVCVPGVAPSYYRWLAWVCYLMGTLAYFVAQFGSKDGGQSGGGGLGVASILLQFQNLSIAAYIFYGWKLGINVWKRPALWLFILSGLALGVLASQKSGTAMPLVYILLAVWGTRGARAFKVIGPALILFGALFAGVLYPVMHYARGVEGVRGGSLSERASLLQSILISYVTDAKFRKYMKEEVDKYANDRVITYLPESAGVFDRFLMIGNSDLLIAGVDHSAKSERFHGFELFTLGLELSVPRILYPAKPEEGSSEYLADVAGTRNVNQKTYPTWGWPSELYYSFGLPGVLVCTFLLQFGFLAMLNLWFGGKIRQSVWFCMLIPTLHFANSCTAIDSLPITLIPFFIVSALLSKFCNVVSAPSPHLSALRTVRIGE